MKSTISSSRQVDAELEILPVEVRAFLHARDAELQRYRQGIARAHQSRTVGVEAAVEACYRDHVRAIEAKPLRNRTSLVMRRLRQAVARGDLDRLPSQKLVRRVVHRLSEK